MKSAALELPPGARAVAVDPRPAHGRHQPLRSVSPCPVDPAPLSLVQIAALLGEQLPASQALGEAVFSVKRLYRHQSLQRAGERFNTIFVVQSGVLMSSVYDSEGTEQVLAFPMRGDVVGLDGVGQSRVVSDVIALETSRVVAIPFAQLSDLSREHGCLQRMVHRLFGRELERERAMLRVLGSCSAESRVASFLLDLSARRARLDGAGEDLLLPMRRQDMARYLGLQLETVSRAMSSLAHLGTVSVDGKRVSIMDACGLRRIADCGTRQVRRVS